MFVLLSLDDIFDAIYFNLRSPLRSPPPKKMPDRRLFFLRILETTLMCFRRASAPSAWEGYFLAWAKQVSGAREGTVQSFWS